jgi:negative regulator of replication initiation
MTKSISVKRKKAGRPATGTEPLYGVRIADELMKQIMDWAKSQGATRSEAIRRLVDLGLTIKTKAKQPSAAQAARAKELAAKAIDKMIDPSAPPEERSQRRRRLIPTEFREDRVDLPIAKGK